MASTIDITGIDATKPAWKRARTADVRNNFGAIKTQLGNAKTDIEALQADKLDTSGDGSSVAVTVTGGAAARTLAARLAEDMDAADKGAVGDGSTDDTAAVQALLTARAGKVARLVAGKTYVVSGVTIATGTRLDGRGAVLKLKAGSTNHVISGTGADRAHVKNLKVDGNVADCPSGGSGIVFTNSDRVEVRDCEVVNVKQSGVYLFNCTRSRAAGNTVTSAGATGIYAYGTDLRVDGNTITTSGGANITYEGSDIAIVGNNCDAGGPSGDNITGYAAGTLRVTIANNTCKNSLNHGIHAGGAQTSITGNVVYAPAQNGIRFETNDGSTATDLAIAGNDIHDPTGDGIYVAAVNRGAVSGNTVYAASNGFNLITVSNVSVAGNTVSGCGSHGFRLAGVQDCSLTGNVSTSNGGDGFSLLASTQASLRNVLVGNRATGNASWGIREISGVGTDHNTFGINDLNTNTSGTLSVSGANSKVLMVEVTGPVASGPYTFHGDTDTGLSRISADVVALTAGGTHRIRAASNYVTLGDGTANPNNFNFRVDSFNEASWDSLSANYQYFKRCGTSINAPTASAADQLLVSLEAHGHTGSAYSAATKIQSYVYDTPSSGVVPGYMAFFTTGTTGSPTRRLTIKAFGQVRFEPLSADPAGAQDGDVYYNSTTGKLRVRAAGAWVDLH